MHMVSLVCSLLCCHIHAVSAISEKGKMKKGLGHHYLKYSIFYISQHCLNYPSQLVLQQMLVFRFLQLGLSSLKGNCVHSFVERTIDVTDNPISLCISFRKQVDLFFPTLAMIHISVQGLEKNILQILPIRQILALAKN